MKALICITTCNRLSEVKKYIWDFLKFTNEFQDFHFLLALDGYDQDYIDFCDEFQIPLLYSNAREGVGLSKNRVLKQFDFYDYYFFIDDDVELLNQTIFQECITIWKEYSIPHLCGNINHNSFKKIKHLNYSLKGGGYFSFYESSNLKEIGGWHTIFAKYKRFGHTEHSYRFYHKQKQKAPFIFDERFSKMILIHSPVSVTSYKEIITNDNELVQDEMELINKKTTYYPLQTISDYFFNEYDFGYNKKVDDFLKENPKKYPLTNYNERNKALGEFYALQIQNKQNSIFKNIFLAIKSFIYSPNNFALKHAIKTFYKY